MISLLGAFFIFTGCLGFGVSYVEKERRRIQGLYSLCSILDLLECEIRLENRTFPEACFQLSKRRCDFIGALFGQIYIEYDRQESESFPQVFCSVMQKYFQNDAMEGEDLEIFFRFLSQGISADRRQQQLILQSSRETLEQKRKELAGKFAEKQKVALGLGTMGGLLLLLILW